MCTLYDNILSFVFVVVVVVVVVVFQFYDGGEISIQLLQSRAFHICGWRGIVGFY